MRSRLSHLSNRQAELESLLRAGKRQFIESLRQASRTLSFRPSELIRKHPIESGILLLLVGYFVSP